MEEHREFLDLMQRLRCRSDGAAQALFDRYSSHVLRVVRRKLDRRMRVRFDSIDFTQEVWASFFALSPDRCEFQDPRVLIAYLARIAEHKVIERFRQQLQTQKYDLHREQSLDKILHHPPAAQADPAETFLAGEEWENLLAENSDREQRILMMLRDEYTHREIADQLGVNEKTVRRLIQRLSASPPP